MIVGTCYAYYRTLMTEKPGDLPVSEFLNNIIIQLIPLVLIKYKIMVFDDGLSAICKFAQKVMLMHFSLFFTRVVTFPFIQFIGQDRSFLIANAFSLAGAFAALHFGFNLKWKSLVTHEHRDLQIIHVFAGIVAAAQQYRYGKISVPDVMTSVWNALEVMAFTPAVYLLYQMDRRAEIFTPLPEKNSRAMAMTFFVFIASFYLHENIFVPLRMAQQGLAAMNGFQMFCGGHLMHLTMLLDFGAFFLFQAWFPKHLKDEATEGESDGRKASEMNHVAA